MSTDPDVIEGSLERSRSPARPRPWMACYITSQLCFPIYRDMWAVFKDNCLWKSLYHHSVRRKGIATVRWLSSLLLLRRLILFIPGEKEKEWVEVSGNPSLCSQTIQSFTSTWKMAQIVKPGPFSVGKDLSHVHLSSWCIFLKRRE